MPSLKEAFRHLLEASPFDVPEEEPEYFERGPTAYQHREEEMEAPGQKIEVEEWMRDNADEYMDDPQQMVYDAAENVGGPATGWIYDPTHWIYDIAQNYAPGVDREYWRDTGEETMY